MIPSAVSRKQRLSRYLIAVEEIPQQLGIVVRSFFSKCGTHQRSSTELAMKPAADLIVNAAQRHALERPLDDLEQLRVGASTGSARAASRPRSRAEI